MLFFATGPLLCLGVYTTDGWPSLVGKFMECFLEEFPVLWLLSKCLHWKSEREKYKWVCRTELKISKQGAGLKICWKVELTGSFPTQYHLHDHAHAFCIWAWKHIRTRNQYVYMIVSWEPKEAGVHVSIQRHDRDNHLTERPGKHHQ